MSLGMQRCIELRDLVWVVFVAKREGGAVPQLLLLLLLQLLLLLSSPWPLPPPSPSEPSDKKLAPNQKQLQINQGSV